MVHLATPVAAVVVIFVMIIVITAMPIVMIVVISLMMPAMIVDDIHFSVTAMVMHHAADKEVARQ